MHTKRLIPAKTTSLNRKGRPGQEHDSNTSGDSDHLVWTLLEHWLMNNPHMPRKGM